jgi:glycosyltransferase involved in cell wall biosynthesis
MKNKFTSLSVFLPVYNEEKIISEVIKRILKVLPAVSDKYELIAVNDGSKDNTKRVLENLNGIKVVSHDENRGYGATLTTGFKNCKYDWITFTDSDGQFDFSEISNFFAKQKETQADLVIGYYKKRQVSKLKIITSKAWEIAVYVLFGLRVTDIDCGFKLVSKKVIDSIMPLESQRGAFISSELLIKARKRGFKIVEIPVTHYPRTVGKGTGRDIKVIIQSFVDLFKLWIKLNFS